MQVPIQTVLENYRAERQRLKDSPYPHVGCSCAFCDVIRAADWLHNRAQLDESLRWWREGLRQERDTPEAP